MSAAAEAGTAATQGATWGPLMAIALLLLTAGVLTAPKWLPLLDQLCRWWLAHRDRTALDRQARAEARARQIQREVACRD